jgi:hypothetical protein
MASSVTGYPNGGLTPQSIDFAQLAQEVAKQVGPMIFGMLSAQPQMQAQPLGVTPYATTPQLNPQGFDFSQIAQEVGKQVGPMIFSMLAAQPQLQGQAAGLTPYGAAPQLTPQGFNFGQLAQHIAPIAGQVIQHTLPLIFSMLAAQPQLQAQTAGLTPYGAAPQLTPQGFVGNLFGQLAPGLGQGIGGAFGQGQLGGQIGSVLGGLGSLLPFQAAPQLTPQGLGFGGLPHQGWSPMNFAGDFDEQRIWHPRDWWMLNRPDWARGRHPEWRI